MSAHPVTWLAPRPLWSGLDGAAARRPSILRFTSDDFMEELLDLLADDPSLLAQRVAGPETWRDGVAAHPVMPPRPRMPLPGFIRKARRGRALAESRALPAPKPALTKLYQPVHGRYYIAAASLACAIPGLPERSFVPGGPEAVGFVLRRILPAVANGSELAEFAFTPGPGGPRWKIVSGQERSPARLSPGEEMLPVFPLPHADSATAPRTLWGGLVPTGRREEYVAATVDRQPLALARGQADALLGGAAPPSAAPGITSRVTRFKSEVAEPWKALVRACYIALAELQASTETAPQKWARARTLNVGWAGQAWLILLDFAKYLGEFLPDVARALDGGPRPARPAEATLFDRLTQITVPTLAAAPDGSMLPGRPQQLTTLAEALTRIVDDEAGLEAAQGIYSLGHQDEAGLPGWHFPLVAITNTFARAGAGVHFTEDAATPAYDADVEPPPETPASPAHLAAAQAAEKLDLLTVLVARALPIRDESGDQPLPFALTMRNAIDQTQGDPGQFVLRFVYLNEDCGPLHPPVLSDPTDPFAIAHFFDYDAPARPIRVTLPLDTSPAALRKYPRNTAFVMSDMLCGQVQRAKGLGLVDLIRHVLPFPLHKPLDTGAGGSCKSGGTDIGMICSLSIPIITICALILLMIIVSLFDFIFRWLPYFVFCFPVRGLKGKQP